MKRTRSMIIALSAALGLQACQDQRGPAAPAPRRILAANVTPPDPAGRHLVVFTAERVPADVGERAARLGGAAVTGLSEAAAAELAASADVRAVEPDVATALRNEDVEAEGAAADEVVSEALAPADAT